MYPRTSEEKGENPISGSITIFLSLMLLLVSSLLFSLLELSRFYALAMMRDLVSQTVVESLFAEYQIPAFKNYHLLMLDAGYGMGELAISHMNHNMQKIGQENLTPDISGFGKYSNFLQMNITNSSVEKYELLTDGGAAVLLEQMVEVMKKETVTGLVESAVEQFAGTKDAVQSGNDVDKYIEFSMDSMQEELERQAQEEAAGQEAGEQTETISRIEQDADKKAGNPIEDMQKTRKSPLLAQILPEGSRISVKQIEGKEAAVSRTLNCGNYYREHSVGIAEKVLLQQYFKKYTSNYKNAVQLPHALNYEQEYLLFGCESDEKNLEKMAGKLVLLREGINFAYLMTDTAKQSEAMALAIEIAAAAGVPAVAKAIQLGLLASWAYAESILELRTLFAGGKIAAVKNIENWNVGLSEMIFAVLDHARKAREEPEGQDYEDYMAAFLYIEPNQKLGLRFASLLEQNLRLSENYEQVKIDCMVTAAEISCEYDAKQVFLTPALLGRAMGGYGFQKKARFQYMQD